MTKVVTANPKVGKAIAILLASVVLLGSSVVPVLAAEPMGGSLVPATSPTVETIPEPSATPTVETIPEPSATPTSVSTAATAGFPGPSTLTSPSGVDPQPGITSLDPATSGAHQPSDAPVVTAAETAPAIDFEDLPATTLLGRPVTLTVLVDPVSASGGSIKWTFRHSQHSLPEMPTTTVDREGRSHLKWTPWYSGDYLVSASFSGDPSIGYLTTRTFPLLVEEYPGFEVSAERNGSDGSWTVIARISPPAAGMVDFQEGPGVYLPGSDHNGRLYLPFNSDGIATVQAGAIPGDRVVFASFIPAGQNYQGANDSAIFFVPWRYTLTARADRTEVIAGETPVVLNADITTSANCDRGAPAPTGVVTFRYADDPAETIGTVTLPSDAPNGYSCAETQFTATLDTYLHNAGNRQIVAAYEGDATYAPQTSSPIGVSVKPDIAVLASNVVIESPTFYPAKDGYGDTLAIRGKRLEDSSVAVRVSNSSGRTVRTLAVASGHGAYSVTWNGRNSSGTILAAGKYQVVQTIRDRAGNTKAVSSSVTLSHKRLAWYAATTTKYGSAFSTGDVSPFGWVSTSRSSYYRGVQLSGNIYDEYAYVQYNFAVKSAVKYGTVKFSVLGAAESGHGAASLWVWNPRVGESDGKRMTGRSYGWYSTSVAGSSHVASGRVSAFAMVSGDNKGMFDIAKVKLTYQYALLK